MEDRIGGKSMRVRPGLACNHSQLEQFIAAKWSSIAALEASAPKIVYREYSNAKGYF